MAGVSKTPIAAAVLMTEMVGGFIVLIPLMIASIVSFLVSGKYSLYENQVTSGKLGLDFTTLGEIKLDSVMTKDVVTIDSSSTVSDAMGIVLEHAHHIYPVIDKGKVIGTITREWILASGNGDAKISEFMTRDFHRLVWDSPASSAFEMMTSEKVSTIIIVRSTEDLTLEGLVTRIDILNAMEHLDDKHHT
jgi:chloride channel protein, CIC family